VAGGAVRADFRDDRKRKVLSAETCGEFAIGGDAHAFGLFLP
jgi:hypothetical protein